MLELATSRLNMKLYSATSMIAALQRSADAWKVQACRTKTWLKSVFRLQGPAKLSGRMNNLDKRGRINPDYFSDICCTQGGKFAVQLRRCWTTKVSCSCVKRIYPLIPVIHGSLQICGILRS